MQRAFSKQQKSNNKSDVQLLVYPSDSSMLTLHSAKPTTCQQLLERPDLLGGELSK
jgi:hypothetical protein